MTPRNTILEGDALGSRGASFVLLLAPLLYRVDALGGELASFAGPLTRFLQGKVMERTEAEVTRPAGDRPAR